MIVFVVLALTLVGAAYVWIKSKLTFWSSRGIPSPTLTFPMGTFKTDKHFAYSFKEMHEQFRGYKYVGLYNMVQPMLLVRDLDAVKSIIIKDFQYFQSRGTYHNVEDDPLSGHLFSMEEQQWRALRQKLTPTFTSGKMKNMCPTVVGIGERFHQTMDKIVERGDKGVDMREMFARFTTDVIGTCAFGLECNSLLDPEAKFRKIGMKVFNEPRYPQTVLFMAMAFPNLARRIHLKVFPDEVIEFFMKAVEDTIELRTKNGIKRNDFVDLLIDLRNTKKSNSPADVHMEGLSMNEIAAQCFVFFLAGFETSSTASSFTIYELAQNQEVQEKLRSHIREVLKRHDGKITYESLKEMDYLEQCLDEGMRKYPPLPMLNRAATKDYTLPDTDAVIPRGTNIAIPVYSFHHDPEIYPEPEIYDPDRFSPEERKARHPCAFLPFGEGPRNCIGERFGMMQAKIGMAYLIGNYKFKLNSQTKPVTLKRDAFVLTPESGLYFDIEKV